MLKSVASYLFGWRGRCTRFSFCLRLIAGIFLMMATVGVYLMADVAGAKAIGFAAIWSLEVPALLLMLSATFKRAHDIGLNGSLVSVVSWIWPFAWTGGMILAFRNSGPLFLLAYAPLLLLALIPGNAEANRYGPAPDYTSPEGGDLA